MGGGDRGNFWITIGSKWEMEINSLYQGLKLEKLEVEGVTDV